MAHHISICIKKTTNLRNMPNTSDACSIPSFVRGELTKNHRTTDEDLTKGGKLPFKVNEQGKNIDLSFESLTIAADVKNVFLNCIIFITGLNPGEWLEEYIKRLNPKNPYLHQRPRSKFNPDEHDPNMDIIYFDNAKIGVNTVAKYMPVVRIYILPTFYSLVFRN